MKCTFLFAAILLSLFVTPVHAGTLFDSVDPASPPLTISGLALSNVADPVLPGTAGELRDLTQTFSNVSTPAVSLPASAIGNPFSISVDYLVPSNTDLSAGSQIYLQVNLDGTNRGSVGFVSVQNTTPDVWNTFTITGLTFPNGDPTNGPNLPAGASDISGSLIVVDGGFSGTPSFPSAGGLGILMDNFRIEAVTVPEPASLFLTTLLCGVGLAGRRRV